MSQSAIAIEDATQVNAYKKLPLVFDRGRDVWIYTDKGERYLDLYGGHAVSVTGHCHPRVVKAIQKQSEKLIFYSNLVYSTIRSEASRKLAESAPPGMQHIFFVNSGSEANENSLKLARKLTGRREIISFEGSFHGRTIGSLSATGISKYREAYQPNVPFHRFAEFGDLQSVERIINENTAAVILEPIMSMAGIQTATEEFLQGLRKLCDRTGSLLIYDEVQTGFGRTGTFFFAPRYEVTPDIISLAKGIASGVPMGAILVSDSLCRQIKPGDLGSTFAGGPLACAALKATIEVIQDEELLRNVEVHSAYLRQRCSSLKEVVEMLGLGFLIGIRFSREASYYQKKLLEKKILTGLSNDPYVLRLLPPLTLKKDEIDLFVNVLENMEE